MKDAIIFFSVIIGFVLFVIATALVPKLIISNYQCKARWENTNPSWGPFQGCMVDWGDSRINTNHIKVTSQEN